MKRYDPAICKVYLILKKEFSKNRVPVVELIETQTGDPFKILVTTMLSARTKDRTTTAAARRLFEKLHTVDDLESLAVEKLERLIYPVGFYHEKARHLKSWPPIIRERFNGMIPHIVEELVKLPGVGRKTANLVVAVAFKKPAVCVDIHVHRIMNRLGYLVSKTPLETEMLLRKHFPVRFWTTFNSYFVSFGQHTCFPVNPRCNSCPVYRFCSRIKVKTKNKPGTADPNPQR
ncbi:MAG: endonuclease III [Chitinispirillaceae bacterium]|nr:endonuclease III [Chitinispirillaceae bacterium]